MSASHLTYFGRAAAAAVLAAVLAPSQASAARLGPLAPFAGYYRGGGTVIGSDGHRERLRCRASGSVGAGGDSLAQEIVCASDSYRFDIRSHVVAANGGVRGQWQEASRGVSGELHGRVSNGYFRGYVAGAGFSAGVSLRARGRHLTFGLRPQGGDVASVQVFLSR
jgi:hypothetical protein